MGQQEGTHDTRNKIYKVNTTEALATSSVQSDKDLPHLYTGSRNRMRYSDVVYDHLSKLNKITP